MNLPNRFCKNVSHKDEFVLLNSTKNDSNKGGGEGSQNLLLSQKCTQLKIKTVFSLKCEDDDFSRGRKLPPTHKKCFLIV